MVSVRSEPSFNFSGLAVQMEKTGTKKGKAVKQLPAMKDMKDKLLTNQREAVSFEMVFGLVFIYPSLCEAASNQELKLLTRNCAAIHYFFGICLLLKSACGNAYRPEST